MVIDRFWLLIIYVSLGLAYERLVLPAYGYWGFAALNSNYTLFWLCGILLQVVSLMVRVKPYLKLLIWLLVLPTVVYGSLTGKLELLLIGLVTYTLLIIPKVYIPAFLDKKIDKSFWYFVISSSILIVMLDSIRRVDQINLSNMLLLNVYETRSLSRLGDNYILVGYLRLVVARIYLPFLSVVFWLRKRYVAFFVCIGCIIFLYLTNGALKSIYMMVPLVFLSLLFDDIFKRLNVLILLWIIIVGFALLEFELNDTALLGDLLIRRLFFTPVLIAEKYLDYLDINGLLFYKYSFLKFFSENDYELTKIIGNFGFSRPEMNANVGVVIDGYVNFGWVGLVLHVYFIKVVMTVFERKNVQRGVGALVVLYIYYFNTSFLGTLVLTHGLIIFLFLLNSSRDDSTYLH